jgi:phage replication O-like protein O
MRQARNPVNENQNGEKKPELAALRTDYTKFPHEMLEKLAMFHFPLYELRVLFVIIRETYGYHRDWAAIALEFFEEKTGIHRRHIQRTIKGLLTKNIIRTRGGYRRIKIVRLNSVVDWRLAPIQAPVVKPRSSQNKSARKGALQAPPEAPLKAPNQAPVPAPIKAHSYKETLKEKGKENLKESARAPALNGAAASASSEDRRLQERLAQEKEAKERLSEFRNLMVRSKLYDESELAALKSKSLEELQQIHGERLQRHVLSNPSGLEEQ